MFGNEYEHKVAKLKLPDIHMYSIAKLPKSTNTNYTHNDSCFFAKDRSLFTFMAMENIMITSYLYTCNNNMIQYRSLSTSY